MFTGVEIAEAAVGHPGLGASAPCDSGEELTLSWQAGLESLGIRELLSVWVTCGFDTSRTLLPCECLYPRRTHCGSDVRLCKRQVVAEGALCLREFGMRSPALVDPAM